MTVLFNSIHERSRGMYRALRIHAKQAGGEECRRCSIVWGKDAKVIR